MPGLHFVDSVDPTSGAESGTLDAVPTMGLKLTLEGTTASGQTLALGDIADSLTLRRDGRPFQTESFRFWHEISQLWYGDVDQPTGTAAEDERVVAYVLFFQPELLQALDVAPNNLRYNLQFNSGTLGDRFGTNDVTMKIEQVSVKPGELPELYTPYCLQDDIDVSGAGTSTDEIDEPNTTRLFFEDPAGVVTDARISIDGNTVMENTDLAGINDQSRLFNRVPDGASAPPFVEYTTLSAVGDVSLFSNRVSYQFRASGSSTIEVTRMRAGDVQDRERLRAALNQGA